MTLVTDTTSFLDRYGKFAKSIYFSLSLSLFGYLFSLLFIGSFLLYTNPDSLLASVS